MCDCLKGVVPTYHLTLNLTGEATAVGELQVPHAFGEDECTYITCEERRRKRWREDRKREYAAHGTQIKKSEYIHRKTIKELY